MTRAPQFIEIDGKRHLWRDLMECRRAQRQAARSQEQATLFELKEDRRPIIERTASDRFLQPSLFTQLDRSL